MVPLVGSMTGVLGDPNFGRDVAAFARIGTGNRGDTGLEETHVPERRGAESVGVEGVDAIVFGRYINDVVVALPGDANVGDVERRGERNAIQRI